jgi:hypothetical protein
MNTSEQFKDFLEAKALLEDIASNSSDITLIEKIDKTLDYLDKTITLLKCMKLKAQGLLPIHKNGFGGKSIEYWSNYLNKEADVSIYETEDLPGHFGFTGCESDQYNSEAEAVNAALNERLAVLNCEWQHAVGETDENRNFSDWLSAEHPLLAVGL